MRQPVRFMVCASLSALSAVLGCVLAVVAWQRAGLPYNEEGQYFDGLVNCHQQSVLALAAVAVVACLLALGFAWAGLKTRRSSSI